jgi:hypothetical protein
MFLYYLIRYMLSLYFKKNFFLMLLKKEQGYGCDSVVGHLPSDWKVLSSSPSVGVHIIHTHTKKRTKNKPI